MDACEVQPMDSKEKAIILGFASANEKRQWLREVKQLVKEFQKKAMQAAIEAKRKENSASSETLDNTNNNPITNNTTSPHLSTNQNGGANACGNNVAMKASIFQRSSSFNVNQQTNNARNEID